MPAPSLLPTDLRLDLNEARALDAAHPLYAFRDAFVVADPDEIYLDGNSLGRLPHRAREVVAAAVDGAWGERLIRSWGEGWWEAASRIGGRLAPLVGAGEDEVVIADQTSVNLYKLATAALDDRAPRTRIVTDALNFPSDLYVLDGVARRFGGRLEIVPAAADGVHADEAAILAAMDDDVALVSLSEVAFASGYRYDAERLTRAAHEVGARVLWDLSHAVGATPVDLNGWSADLAVGCTYKYLNGGPGAPAFAYVRRDLQDRLTQPIHGWFGQTAPFDFGTAYAPAPGMARFTVGTPPVLSLLAMEPGVELVREAGIDAVRDASVALTTYLVALVDGRLAEHGVRVASPRDADRRGSHVTIDHPDGYRLTKAMIDVGVIPDYREGSGIRLGVAPLYLGFEDLWHAVDRIADLLAREAHRAYDDARATVT